MKKILFNIFIIFFLNNCGFSPIYLQENNIDSSYHYAKKAFDGLPNNMPHYDMYMRTLAFKRDATAINDAFNRVHQLAGDTKGIWTIYLRTLALTRSLGDPFSMAKAQEAFKLYPTDENIFIGVAFVTITAAVICFPTISLWALFGSGLRKFVTDVKIKKIIEYLLAVLLVLTGLFILIK